MDVDSTSAAAGPTPRGADLVFYDGVCALCNGAVRFLLRRDDERRFRYAPLQSDVAETILGGYDIDASCLEAMVLIEDWGGEERVHRGPRAVLRTLQLLGGGWKLLRPLTWLPDFVLRPAYALVAKTRYRIFGRYDECRIPEPEIRELFLDVGEPGDGDQA